jgi:hypothetical protein
MTDVKGGARTMTAAEIQQGKELEQVEAWRLGELQRAGYPRDLAEEIARRHDIDLHMAVDLVVGGCTPELAARILL